MFLFQKRLRLSWKVDECKPPPPKSAMAASGFSFTTSHQGLAIVNSLLSFTSNRQFPSQLYRSVSIFEWIHFRRGSCRISCADDPCRVSRKQTSYGGWVCIVAHQKCSAPCERPRARSEFDARESRET